VVDVLGPQGKTGRDTFKDGREALPVGLTRGEVP